MLSGGQKAATLSLSLLAVYCVWLGFFKILERSGLSDYQWCQTNDIVPGTFYMWISRLKKAGYTIPDSTAREKATPVIQEVVKLPVVDSETTENSIVAQNVNLPTTVSRTAVEIELNGVIIRIHNKADADVIQSVLQTVGGHTYAW